MWCVVLLLTLALTAAPAEAIDASFLAGKLSNCIFELCSVEISSCYRLFGALASDNNKACMKLLCTNQMKVCVDWIMSQRMADTGVEMIRTSFLHCYSQCGFQNKTKFTGCFLDTCVDKTQPYISMLAAGSSDPDFLLCWLRQGLGAMKNCFGHYSDLSYDIIINIVREIIHHQQKYVTCFINMYNYGDTDCLQMFMQLFGFETMPARAKDFFICSINDMISFTSSC